MSVCCECCVLLGSGLCDELITRPEESYRLWCVVVCDLENFVNEEALAHWGAVAPKTKKNLYRPADTRWRSCLRLCATCRKIAGSLESFIGIILPALGLTKSLTEKLPGIFPGGVKASGL